MRGSWYLRVARVAIHSAGKEVLTVVAEVTVYSWQHVNIARHTSNGAKKINSAFERASEEASTGQEEVSHSSGLKIEGGRGTEAFQDLEVHGGEEGADEFALGGRDGLPEGVGGFDDGEPFDACGCWGGGEAVVEEFLDGCFFGGGVIFGDETHETAWRVLERWG